MTITAPPASQNEKLLSRAMARDFTLNRVPVLIADHDDTMRRLMRRYAAASRDKVFTLDGKGFHSVDDLIIKEYIDLNSGVDPLVPVEYDELPADATVLTITRLPKEIEDAIDYAESHPGANPVLIFDDLDCGNPDIVIAIFEAAVRRHFDAIRLPCNLKIMVLAHSDTVLDTIHPRYRGRFATHRIIAERNQLLVSR